MVIKAIYKNGVFTPLEEVPLEEGTEVEVHPRLEHGKNRGKSKRKSVKDYEAFGMWVTATTSAQVFNTSTASVSRAGSDLNDLPH